jgi:hypothetical protein
MSEQRRQENRYLLPGLPRLAPLDWITPRYQFGECLRVRFWVTKCT